MDRLMIFDAANELGDWLKLLVSQSDVNLRQIEDELCRKRGAPPDGAASAAALRLRSVAALRCRRHCGPWRTSRRSPARCGPDLRPSEHQNKSPRLNKPGRTRRRRLSPLSRLGRLRTPPSRG
jgi:hypothetical protein